MGQPPLSTEQYDKFIDSWLINYCFGFETILLQEFDGGSNSECYKSEPILRFFKIMAIIMFKFRVILDKFEIHLIQSGEAQLQGLRVQSVGAQRLTGDVSKMSQKCLKNQTTVSSFQMTKGNPTICKPFAFQSSFQTRAQKLDHSMIQRFFNHLKTGLM